MKDYLEIFEKFKDIKEIKEFINDVNNLRFYFNMGNYQQMQEHINSLTKKYFVDTLVWNSVNYEMPTTYPQSYINAENFLQMQGAKILVKNVLNYKQYLTDEEIKFIELMTNPME